MKVGKVGNKFSTVVSLLHCLEICTHSEKYSLDDLSLVLSGNHETFFSPPAKSLVLEKYSLALKSKGRKRKEYTAANFNFSLPSSLLEINKIIYTEKLFPTLVVEY